MNNTLEILRGCMIAIGSTVFVISIFSFLLFKDDYKDADADMAVNMSILFNVVSGIGTLWMVLFWRV